MSVLNYAPKHNMELRGQLDTASKEPPLPAALGFATWPSTDLSWLQSVNFFMTEFISFLASVEVASARVNV
jgi:hypothetical protein